MKRFFCLLMGVCISFSFVTLSQQPHPEKVPPKYGLALSGGGAKGLVYVGLLQMIDSLQIHIDYISGTSMGAVLGGLYAAGFSGDSLRSIVLNADWRRIISNKQPYNHIHIREKSEYDSYLFEFPVKKGIPSLPNSFIEGQYLSELLQNFTFPVRNIHDFHAMPIPVELVASDIVNGGAVVMREGYLPLAIRASLAIPAAFSPVIINGTTLVDGGLDRNFPVEEVRNMGADFVIGSYSGSRTRSEAELENNPLGLLNQAFALLSKRDVNRQKDQVDLLFDFTQTPLKDYSSSDFFKFREILAIGDAEAHKLLPQLIEVKQLQQKQGIVYRRRLPQAVSVSIDRVDITDEMGNSLPLYETKFIRSILGNDLKALDDAAVLQEKTEQIISYNRYDKVFYTYSRDPQTGEDILTFVVKRKPEGTFHAVFHYDTQESASLILNYTYRGLLLNNSRLTAKVNVSERFKARVNYYKFLDERGRFWFKGETYYNLQTSNDLSLKYISEYFNKAETRFYNRNSNVSFSAGTCFDPSREAAAGIEYNVNRLWRPHSSFSDELLGNEQSPKAMYRHGHLALFSYYEHNSLNHKFFAAKGSHFKAEAKLFLHHHHHLGLPDSTNEGMKTIHTLLHPDSSLFPIKGKVLQLSLSEHYVFPLSNRLSLHTHLFYGLNFDLKKSLRDNFHFDSYLFLSQKFYLGGYANFNPDNRLIFSGLRNNAYPVNNIASLYLGLQYHPGKKLFITSSLSVAAELGGIHPFTDDSDFLLGYGVDVDYMSLMGPLKFSFSRSTLLRRNRYFISLGYIF